MRALASGAGSSWRGSPAGERGKLLRDGGDEVIVVQIAGGGEDHVAAMEAVAVVVEELLRSSLATVAVVPRIGLPSG